MGNCLTGPSEIICREVNGQRVLEFGKLRKGVQWVAVAAPNKAWGVIPLGTTVLVFDWKHNGLARVTAQIVHDVSDSGHSSIADHLPGTDRPGPSAFRDAVDIARREPDRRCCLYRLRVAYG